MIVTKTLGFCKMASFSIWKENGYMKIDTTTCICRKREGSTSRLPVGYDYWVLYYSVRTIYLCPRSLWATSLYLVIEGRTISAKRYFFSWNWQVFTIFFLVIKDTKFLKKATRNYWAWIFRFFWTFTIWNKLFASYICKDRRDLF